MKASISCGRRLCGIAPGTGFPYAAVTEAGFICNRSRDPSMLEKDYQSVGGEARQLWEKGYDTLEKKNYDYAMELLTMALEKEPAFFDCRMALRAAQVKKHEGMGKLAKMAAAAGSATHMAAAKLALSKKSYFGAMNSAEKVLCADPYNSVGHRVIVDAAHALDYPQTMISSLQLLKKANPKDNEIAKELGEALEMLGDWDTAENLMLQLAQTNPEDQELQQAYKDTAAKATIYRGNYEGMMSGKNPLAVNRNEEEDEGPKLTAEEALEEKIYHMEERLQEEPENFKLAVDIARLYVEYHDFDRAFEYYDYVMDNCTVIDSSIDRSIADAHEARFNHDIAQYPEGTPEREGLEMERDQFMIANAAERADKFPTMLEFRFEYGERLFRAGHLNEAVQAFQRSQNSPGHKHRSLCYLGQCFMQRGMHDMAVSQFEKALEGKNNFDDQTKEATYLLACVYEQQGRQEEAARKFKTIYEVDIGYRDVASRVESGYSAGA